MSEAIENLERAQQRAMAGRSKVGGFPYLAETLRRAGVTRNLWYLPSCQSVYLTQLGAVVQQGTPLVTGVAVALLFGIVGGGAAAIWHQSEQAEATR